MGTLFLQESEATILLADIRDFTKLVHEKKSATIELAITLSRFYEHVANATKAEGGRVIKLVGDGVLCAFIGTADHRQRALRAVRRLVDGRAELNESAKFTNMPSFDYTVVCGSGRILAGDLGAAKLQGFDVIGDTVNRVFRLSHLATRRRVSHLIEASTWEPLPHGERPSAAEVGSMTAEETGSDEVKLYA